MWTGVTLVLLFCLYLLAGFYWLPGVIRSQATAWVKTNLDKEIALGEIRFNPLSFTLDVSDIAIPGRDGPMVALGHLHVRFALLSVVESAWRFREVRLDKPFVHAVLRPDHSLNLLELEPRTHSEGPTPAVRIDDFTVDGGRIVYADQSQPGAPEAILSPIAFTLKDFHTKSDEGGAFTLEAQSQRGEHFDWKGDLSIAPVASHGVLTVAELQSATVQRFFGAQLPVALTGGDIGFHVDYDFAYDKGGMRLTVTMPDLHLANFAFQGRPSLFDGTVKLGNLNASVGIIAFMGGSGGVSRLTGAMPRIAVEDLSILPPGAAPGQGIALKSAMLTDSRFDFGARRIDLGNLTLDGADLYVRRDRDKTISLMRMLPQKPAADRPGAMKAASVNTKTASPPASPGAPPTAPASWKIGLRSLALNGATVRLEDRAVTPDARITIAPLTIAASGGDLTQPVNLHVDATVNGKGHFTGDGMVTPMESAGDVKFRLADLQLRDLRGYMPPMPGLDLRSGGASASGKVHFKGGNLAELRFKGDAAIDRFDLQETSTNSPLFAWRSFSLRGINYAKRRVTVGSARLVAPVGQVAVLADRRFNFTALMAPPAPKTAVPIQQKAPAAKTPAAPSFLFTVRRLDIQSGTMGFADYSIDPNFQAKIEALEGRISNITDRPGQAAAIDLTGQVIDRFSPVSIKGRMDLLGYDRLTDMQLSFRNIDLPVFNPYSGRYAGYAIAKGKLTTELSYKIDHRALKADQHVVIDQLEWGQATDSKDRVPLPIRLATALLKDKDGVIDLNLPVTGSLDDPSFSVWPIVWKIVGNIIEKAVAAPFQLIGALFAGADKAQFIDFQPGSAALPQGSAEALGALAKAMADRPVLKLDIPAGPATPEDAVSMADARIDAALMEREAKRGQKVDVTMLDADELHDRLEDLYSSKLGKDPEFPKFTPDDLKKAPGAKPDMDEDDRRTLLESQWMRDQLRTAFKPSNTELVTLGSARATAVRDALLADGSIDPARVFLTTALNESSEKGHSRLALKFE